VPVISVGNLVVGGTGKTPTVAHLVERLLSRGRRVGVVMGGYRAERRSREGWTLVSDGCRLCTDLAFAGDEAFLFATTYPTVPVAVGRRKAFVAERLTQAVRVDGVVVDDGFQHRRLFRDVDVVLLDARDPFGNGRVLPAGRLREPPDALRYAHLIILSHAENAHDLDALYKVVAQLAPGVPTIASRHVPARIRVGVSSETYGLDVLRGCRVVAVSGIGSPEGFTEMLRELGAEVVEARVFPDHHRYTHHDLAVLSRLAARLTLVTTAKDAVKWEGRADFPFLTLEIRVEWSSVEPVDLMLTALGL